MKHIQPRTENDTTTEKKVAPRKPPSLELAGQLGNVRKASWIVGYSRQRFCDIRRNMQTYSADGLLDRMAGPRNPNPRTTTRTSTRPKPADRRRGRANHQPITVSVQTAFVVQTT